MWECGWAWEHTYLPLCLVEVGDVDGCGVTDGVDEGEGSGSLRWRTRQAVGYPSIRNDERGCSTVLAVAPTQVCQHYRP